MWTEIAKQIARVTNSKFTIEQQRSIGGGCINQAYRVKGNNAVYFVKLNSSDKLDMFVAEALGLEATLATKTIKVPQPICWGVVNTCSYLVLEWLELGSGNNQAWWEMGKKLAAMHQEVGTHSQFGWQRHNTIGSTVQINTWTDNWADFFAEHRLGYQLKLANRRGGNFSGVEEIVFQVKEILRLHHPQPSLVHGDLWSGNAAITVGGEPIIFDPATYYGDREVDLAMTELFGGFPSAFYQGYNSQWPIDSGYTQRKNLYNLYHILNHFNLFGGGYEGQAKRMLGEILT